jgi:2-oxoglutarate ferredoxin oxidoreductase subunit alpha
MTAAAFDLTEHLQTPVIVMTDLDLGMNDHVTDPLEWNDSREYDRGKVLTAQQLDSIYGNLTSSNGHSGNGAGDPIDLENQPDPEAESAGSYLEQFKGKFGRYLDVDGDGIPYRTIPGTHSTRGAFVTRGSSRDEYAVYTEDADVYQRFVDRLARKWDTAKELVPQPEFYSPQRHRDTETETQPGVPGTIFFGTSTDSALEALELLADEGILLDAMRPRAFPFGKAFRDFVEAHERIFVIEQNRDAQFRSLMMIELGVGASKLVSVLNYDGMPITADNILKQIKSDLNR